MQCGNRLPRGPAVSSLGWTEPWLTRHRAEESPASLEVAEVASLGSAPPAFQGFGGVSSSPQHNRAVREGTKTPDSVEKSI